MSKAAVTVTALQISKPALNLKVPDFQTCPKIHLKIPDLQKVKLTQLRESDREDG